MSVTPSMQWKRKKNRKKRKKERATRTSKEGQEPRNGVQLGKEFDSKQVVAQLGVVIGQELQVGTMNTLLGKKERRQKNERWDFGGGETLVKCNRCCFIGSEVSATKNFLT